MKLSATRVKALRDPGRYSDGDGLHLFISKAGGKSWVQRITIDGRRRDIGLGGYPTVSLAQARKRAADNRASIADGKDPVEEKRKPAELTFSRAARAVHEVNRPRWRNERHALSWMQTLERHAFPKIGSKPIASIGRTDVLTVLTPIWSTRPETARRVRQRMRTVFRWAMANELIEMNPAGEAIDGALPSMPKIKAHLRALPYQDVGSALKTVDASQTSLVAKRCLRFLVLTAARSGEARGATWDEIDLDGATWTIPASRMTVRGGPRASGPPERPGPRGVDPGTAAGRWFGDLFPVSSAIWPDAERHDPDEGPPLNRPCRPGDGTRVPNVLQDMDDGTDGYALGSRGGGTGPSAWRQCRTGLRTVRSVRPPPQAHAAVGGLPHGIGGARRADVDCCHRHRPGLYPDADFAFLPPDGRSADLDRWRESSTSHQPVNRGAAQSRELLNLSTT